MLGPIDSFDGRILGGARRMVAALRYPWDGFTLILVVVGLYWAALAGASVTVWSNGYLLGTAAGVSAVVAAAALASHLHYTFEGR